MLLGECSYCGAIVPISELSEFGICEECTIIEQTMNDEGES